MQGKYDPNLIKAILNLFFYEHRTYRETAEILNISEKTVGRQVRHARKVGFSVDDLRLSAPELAAKLQPKRFSKESGVLHRTGSMQKKYLTKKHLDESCKKISEGRYNYAECYRAYLCERSEKEHFCVTSYKQFLQERLRKNILEKTTFFSVPWTAEDVLKLSGFVGGHFRHYAERVLNSSSSGSNDGAASCMKLLNFIHGDIALYEFAEELIASSPSEFFSLAYFWRKLIRHSRVHQHELRVRWDRHFFDYVDSRKKAFQQSELKRLGLEAKK